MISSISVSAMMQEFADTKAELAKVRSELAKAKEALEPFAATVRGEDLMKHPIETVLRNIATYDDWIDTDLRKHVMVAADEIDSLRSELAKAREEIKRLRDTLSFAKARLGVEVSTLKAELARARAALGPFAKAAHCYEYTPPIYDDRDLADNDHVTVGDLRRARLALQPEETP